MKNKYWTIFYNDILKNKKLVFFTAFVGILCFGFTVTHFSAGIDDIAFAHYFGTYGIGNLIQQGRLTHMLLYKLTGVGECVPFFNDFIGAVLFCLSALLFCALFKLIAKDKISNFSLLTFCVIYVSYSAIVHKFTYNLDVVVTMLSYCACAVSLGHSYLFIENNKKSDFIFAILTLIIAIGSYETFVFMYISGVFAMLIIKMSICDEKLSAKAYFTKGFKCALILILSAVLYYGLVLIVQLSTKQFGIFERSNELSGLGFGGAMASIGNTLGNILATFMYGEYFPIREYFVFSLIGLLVCVFYVVKTKRVLIILSYIMALISNIAIFFVFGGIPNRATQTFSLLVGFVAMLVANSICKKDVIKRVVAVLVVVLVFVQAVDMNINFYNDYKRYQKETAVADSVAMQIIRYDINKPVVFVGNEKIKYLDCESGGMVGLTSHSAISWSLTAFDSFYKDKPEQKLIERPYTIEFFHMLGYDFIKVPTREQAQRGIESAQNMNVFPNDGYVEEFDDYIVVKMS